MSMRLEMPYLTSKLGERFEIVWPRLKTNKENSKGT